MWRYYSHLSPIQRLIALYRASHGGGTPITLRGTSPLSLANAVKGKLKKLLQYGKVSVSDGVITCNNGTLSVVDGEIVTTGTAEEVTVRNRNLFMLDGRTLGKPSSTTAAYTTKREFDESTFVKGLSRNNYYYPGNASDYSVENNLIKIAVSSNSGSYGIGIPFVLEAGTYNISFTADGARLGVAYYQEDGTWVRDGVITSSGTSITVNTGEKYVVFIVITHGATDYGTMSNIMLVKGNLSEEYITPTKQSVSDIPNLYAVDSLTDEHDIITGKTIRRTEATVYDSSNPPTGRFIGNATDGSVIVQALETVYENDAVVTFTADGEPLNLVKADFSPVQDLHGQDAPWPAGGGKNKLNWDRPQGTPNPTTSSPDTSPRTMDTEHYYVGITRNNYYGPLQIQSASVTNGVVSVESLSGGYGVGFPVACSPNTTYTVSYTEVTNAKISMGYYDANWEYLDNTDGSYGTETTFATPADCAYVVLVVVPRTHGSGNPATAKDIQLELGSTATSFAPYSNECPISGWTGLDIYDDPAYGGLIEWNQLVQNGNFADTSVWTAYGSTWTVADNVATVTCVNSALPFIYQAINTVAGHKYLISVDVRSNDYTVAYIYWDGNNISGHKTISSDWKEISLIYTGLGNGINLSLRGDGAQDGWTWQQRNFILFDLTAMFGAGNEPATVEAFRELFPKDYYPYNAGTETTVSAVNGNPYWKVAVTWQDEAGTVYGGTAEVAEDGTATGSGTWEIKNPSGWGWTYGAVDASHPFGYFYINVSAREQGVLNVMCDRYKTQSGFENDKVIFGNTTGKILYVVDSNYTDAASFKASLSNAQIAYELATPVTYHLPSVEALQAIKGINTMWHSANGKITVALADADVIEQVTPQPITLSEGTNTVSWTAEVEGKEMEVTYKEEVTE